MKGFTLIELIIVILIIGIFAAVVIGNLFGKEEHNFMVECVQHEPHYQCAYKWKQMHPELTVAYTR